MEGLLLLGENFEKKPLTNTLFTYTKSLPILVTHRIPQFRSKAGE